MIYVSIFIPITLNTHRVFSYFNLEGGTIIGTPWRFHLPELLFQIVYQFIFCLAFGYLNLKYSTVVLNQKSFVRFKIIILNLIALVFVFFTGATVQDLIFNNVEDITLH